MMNEDKIFKVDSDRYISYFDVGKGKVVLFIHGWLTSKESWIPVIQNFDKRKYRIIAIDMLGHGNSSRSLKLRFDTRENVSILTRFVLSLGVRNITIVGHSTGGKVSLFLANRLHSISKSIVKKVILVNSIGSYEFWKTLHPILKIAFFKPVRFLLGFFTLPIFISFYFKKFLFHMPISEKVKENIAKYLVDYTSLHFSSIKNKICALRITKNLFDMFVEDIDRSDLPDIEIIWSKEDKLVPIQVQYKFSQLFRRPVYILPGAGHMTPIEIPDELARILTILIESKKV